LSWKDINHPAAGGAELVSSEIMKRLVRDGHKVKLLTSQYKESASTSVIDGVEVYRSGNKLTVYHMASLQFKKKLSNWPDIVISEMNTIPFFGVYSNKKNILLCYQLAREVWFYQMFFPMSLFGYLAEPIMLRAISKKYSIALTESISTKNDLMKYGFNNVKTFNVGMGLASVKSLDNKKRSGIVLCLGSVRPMKRTLHAVKAFEYARDINKNLKMVIAGDISSSYAKKVIDYIHKSRYADFIDIKGRVSSADRIKLMSESDLILVTSIKEGWGLIVTEANSQGTPAVVYNADGLRDSVKDGQTGLLSPNSNPKAMADKIIELLSDNKKYEIIRKNAWQWSKEFTFENSYQSFLKNIIHQ
jgi:glycosyltransferase involved in cell wall biosynthesis